MVVHDAHRLGLAHLRPRHFYTALIAYDTLVTHSLVFATVALPVLCGSKYTLAEEAIALGLQCSIVNGLWLRYLAVRPAPDFLGRRQADADGIEMLVGRELLEQVEQGFHVNFLKLQRQRMRNEVT